MKLIATIEIEPSTDVLFSPATLESMSDLIVEALEGSVIFEVVEILNLETK